MNPWMGLNDNDTEQQLKDQMLILNQKYRPFLGLLEILQVNSGKNLTPRAPQPSPRLRRQRERLGERGEKVALRSRQTPV